MYRCSFAKTFWILLCREVRAQKLLHDTNSMLFSQPLFYSTFPLSCVWNSAMFPIMLYKLFNANSTVFLFFRSSRPEVFCKIGVFRNFAKLTGKHLCQSLFFDKVAGLRPATLLKKRSGTGVFLWILWNSEEHHFLQNTSGGCFCFFSVSLQARNQEFFRAGEVSENNGTSINI